MSDEQRKDETEVEGHVYPPKYGADEETAKDEVEGHFHRRGANDEQGEEDEVEGHVHRRS